MASGNVAVLLAWCLSQGIRIDPRIQIRGDEEGIRVFAGDAYITHPTRLVDIPKAAILSTRSCSLSGVIAHAAHGMGARLALALAVYGELLKGEDSRWFGYLQALPQKVAIALFWESDGGEDGRAATEWARGTQVEREVRGGRSGGVGVQDEVRRYFRGTAAPLLARARLAATAAGFARAYALVSSRAFLVDAYHGLAMVPIADAFNHSQEHHVHLETDYDVCAVCGSVWECPHDAEDAYSPTPDLVCGSAWERDVGGPCSPTPNAVCGSVWERPRDAGDLYSPTSRSGDGDDTCEMVSNSPILPFAEIFNTYGEQLTNAQLLVQYGFALDGNENDVISWDIEELQPISETRDRGEDASIKTLLLELLQVWRGREGRWDNSNLVYESEGADTAQATRATQRQRQMKLCINAEAKMSHELWLYCALVSMRHTGLLARTSETSDLLGTMEKVAKVQVLLEAQLEDAETSAGDDPSQLISDGGNVHWKDGGARGDESVMAGRTMAGYDYLGKSRDREGRMMDRPARGADTESDMTEAVTVIQGIVRTVVQIYENKVGGMRGGGLSGEELGVAVDGIPGHMTLSRIAATHALGERSLLESWATSWIELGRELSKK